MLRIFNKIHYLRLIIFKKTHVRSYEVGLKFREGEFVGLLGAGKHYVFTRFGKTKVEVVSKRDPWIQHEQLVVIVKSGALADKAEVVDLRDHGSNGDRARARVVD